MQARERPLRYAVGAVDGRAVGCFEEVLADDVDCAFARRGQVAQSVLGVREAAREADGEEGRVVVDDVGVGEGG